MGNGDNLSADRGNPLPPGPDASTGLPGTDPGAGFDPDTCRPAPHRAAPTVRASRLAGAMVFACVAVLVLLAVLGSVLAVGDRLFEANAVLGSVFYTLVAVLLAVGVVYPLASIAARPVFSLWRLRDSRGRAKMRWCRRLVANLEAGADLTPAERAELRACLDAGDGADDRLIAFFNVYVVPALDLETKRAAKAAFFATAVSQSALVDAVTMLSINFNLVRSIVTRCGFRPTAFALGRLYVRIMASALVAGGLEDMDMEGLLAGVMGGAVPGAVLASATQGIVNSFLVYRVGVMTKRHLCAVDGPVPVDELRRASYREALSLMRSSGFAGEVFQSVRDKTGQAAATAVNAAKNAAANTARSARDSMADAARRLADAFSRRAES